MTRGTMTGRTQVASVASAVLAFVLANLARHRLVEPAHLTALCDAAPWEGLACSLRTLTVQTFAAHRLGLIALGCALIAALLRSRGLALLALASGVAGLVLYSTLFAAPAVLVASLVLARAAKDVR
jgi:hypothetical protein